jgi:exonuclease VII small subunit
MACRIVINTVLQQIGAYRSFKWTLSSCLHDGILKYVSVCSNQRNHSNAFQSQSFPIPNPVPVSPDVYIMRKFSSDLSHNSNQDFTFVSYTTKNDTEPTLRQRPVSEQRHSIQLNSTQINAIYPTIVQHNCTYPKMPPQRQPDRRQLRLLLEQLQRDHDQLKRDYTQLESKNAQLESNNAQLESNIAQLESNHTQLESNHTQLENSTAQLENSTALFELGYTRLEEDLAFLYICLGNYIANVIGPTFSTSDVHISPPS